MHFRRAFSALAAAIIAATALTAAPTAQAEQFDTGWVQCPSVSGEGSLFDPQRPPILGSHGYDAAYCVAARD